MLHKSSGQILSPLFCWGLLAEFYCVCKYDVSHMEMYENKSRIYIGPLSALPMDEEYKKKLMAEQDPLFFFIGCV
jgi:hypothetical protein